MKFIRTNDGIFKVIREEVYCGVKFYNYETEDHLNRIGEECITKQGDTIVELCDGYYLDIDNHPFDVTQIYDKDELQKALKEKNDWQQYSDRKYLGYEINLYAFIKTEKGLIYVTKLNENNIVKPILSEIVNIESYTGENCKKCGRCRVELVTLSSGNKYHICEKCKYIEEQDRYCDNSDFSYDIYSDHKTYLYEVIQKNRSENNGNN